MALPSWRHVGQSNSSHTSTPPLPNHHCKPCYPTSLISITIWYIILLSHSAFITPQNASETSNLNIRSRPSVFVDYYVKVDRVRYRLCTSLDGILQMNIFYSLPPFISPLQVHYLPNLTPVIHSQTQLKQRSYNIKIKSRYLPQFAGKTNFYTVVWKILSANSNTKRQWSREQKLNHKSSTTYATDWHLHNTYGRSGYILQLQS